MLSPLTATSYPFHFALNAMPFVTKQDGAFLIDANAPSVSHSVLENEHVPKSKQQKQTYTESKKQALAETTALENTDHFSTWKIMERRSDSNVLSARNAVF